MDQASAHRAHEIDWPENIIPLFQPAYTPEVNPIERFWKHLKTPLQWETFKNLKALRQRVQTVLANMTEDIVRSVTGWEFITNAVLSVSSKMNWYYCLFKAKAHQFFRFQSLSVFDSTIQDFRGTSHVEKIVRIDWRSKWQEIARLNDDAVDGIIFLKRGRKPTSAIAFAQVKCGPGYRKDAQIRPNHIGVQVGAKYIEDHLPRWRSLNISCSNDLC